MPGHAPIFDIQHEIPGPDRGAEMTWTPDAQPSPSPVPRLPGSADPILAIIPVAVLASSALLLVLACVVQWLCGGRGVRRGSVGPGREGWFVGSRDGLLRDWRDRINAEGENERSRGISEDLRAELGVRAGGRSVPPIRFVANGDVGAASSNHSSNNLFDSNDPLDDVLAWGGVSVHEGRSITFRKWSERCAVADLPLYSSDPTDEYCYFEAMLSLVGPDTEWVEQHRLQLAQAASAAQAQQLAQAAQLVAIPDVDVPPEGYDRSQYDNEGARASSAGPSVPTSPTQATPASPTSLTALASVLSHLTHPQAQFQSQFQFQSASPTARQITRTNSTSSLRSNHSIHESTPTHNFYTPSSRTLHSLLPTKGDPHVTMSIGLCTRPYPPFLLPGRLFDSVAYVTSSDGAWICSCAEDEFGREVRKSWFLGHKWTARQGDTVGVGYHPRRGGVFFTVNGELVPIPDDSLEKSGPSKGEDMEPLLADVEVRDEWARYFAVQEARFAWYPSVGATGPGVVLVNSGPDLLWDGRVDSLEIIVDPGPAPSFDSPNSGDVEAESPGPALGVPRRAVLQDPRETIDAALDNPGILNPDARRILSRGRGLQFVPSTPPPYSAHPSPNLLRPVTPRRDSQVVRGHGRSLSGTLVPEPPNAERVGLLVRRSEDGRQSNVAESEDV